MNRHDVNGFSNLSVRAKCSVAMGLMVVLLGAVIFTGYRSIKTIQQSQTRLFEIEFANATDLLDDLRHKMGYGRPSWPC